VLLLLTQLALAPLLHKAKHSRSREDREGREEGVRKWTGTDDSCAVMLRDVMRRETAADLLLAFALAGRLRGQQLGCLRLLNLGRHDDDEDDGDGD
jgi:hypothetical protein